MHLNTFFHIYDFDKEQLSDENKCVLSENASPTRENISVLLLKFKYRYPMISKFTLG